MGRGSQPQRIAVHLTQCFSLSLRISQPERQRIGLAERQLVAQQFTVAVAFGQFVSVEFAVGLDFSQFFRISVDFPEFFGIGQFVAVCF